MLFRKVSMEANRKELLHYPDSLIKSMRTLAESHVVQAQKFQKVAKKMFWAAYQVNQLVSVYQAAATQAVDAVNAKFVA